MLSDISSILVHRTVWCWESINLATRSEINSLLLQHLCRYVPSILVPFFFVVNNIVSLSIYLLNAYTL